MRLVVALALLAAACSSGSGRAYVVPDGGGAGGLGGAGGRGGAGGGASGSGGGAGTSSGTGAVALLVTSASAPALIDSSPPSSGNSFEELDIVLVNKSSTAPVSLDFGLFTLGTDQSLVVDASGLSGTLTPECSPTNAVASGGSFSCKLAFEIPTGQKATTLYYDDKQGHQASASVPALPPPPPTCQQSLGALLNAHTNPSGPCASCASQADGTTSSQCGAKAAAAQSACTGNCDSTCYNASSYTPASYCSCYEACATPACWTAFQDLLACMAKTCASSC